LEEFTPPTPPFFKRDRNVDPTQCFPTFFGLQPFLVNTRYFAAALAGLIDLKDQGILTIGGTSDTSYQFHQHFTQSF